MSDAEFKKNFNAAEAEATHIIQTQNPKFRKIEGDDFKRFYEQFEIQYNLNKTIDATGQKVNVMGIQLVVSVHWARNFLQYYANTRAHYSKSVPFLGASFGRLIGAVNFGFKNTNPDVGNYKGKMLERVIEMRETLKTINPRLKLKCIPKRILDIYQENTTEVHFFAVQFAQELSR